MHICCSNCSILPLEQYLLRGIDIKGFWFNPNIHPYTEYVKRLDSLARLQRIWGLDIEYCEEYPLDDFLSSVIRLGKNRCAACYFFRLQKTALAAKDMNLDGFTTSLLASPYQKFDMIISIGQEMEKNHNIPFFYDDLRQGWNTSRELSREFSLYRQKYCGCVYSEMERFRDKGKKTHT